MDEEVIIKAERAVETVLNNMLPMPRCSREKEHVKKRREKVKQELSAKLFIVGSTQLK